MQLRIAEGKCIVAPTVAIVILAWNGLVDTLACLRSLAKLDYDHNCLTLVLVDNGSTDSTVKTVLAQFPSVVVIENAVNLGYAGGNNVGLRYALEHNFDYTLLLNNDTEVAPDFLTALVSAAEQQPAIGMVGPTIYYHHAPTRVWSAGGCIDWRRGTSAMRGLDELDNGQFAAAAEVDFISGCALLCKRSVLIEAGLLDERFFMYYEETEWCVRAVRAGYRCLHVPQAAIWHKIRPDHQEQSPRIAYYMARNRLLFLRATGVSFYTWFQALVLQDLRTYLSLSIRPKWRGKRAQRNAMLYAWRDFWSGHFGRSQHISQIS